MKLTLSNCITLFALISVPAALAQSEQELASQVPQNSVAQTANEMSISAISDINEMGTNVAQNANALGATEQVNESQAATGKVNDMQADTNQNINENQADVEKVKVLDATVDKKVDEMEAAATADEKNNGVAQNLNQNIKVVENVDPVNYASTVAVASFPGPNIVGEFSFYQDSTGKVVATGALQKGLVPDAEYHFRFHNGPSCESLGEAVSHHSFRSMRVMEVGGTAPIQETIEDVHLTGKNGLVGSPWVLSDGTQDVACVVLKGQ